MPRPGPRPYECVRRAWHSDRHNPIRGSLIQEIFRIANEVHSSASRKNKEWQEKLPIVVIRAEEIMYSKANSEAEYTNVNTLWDRVNDAIDTIIRRDKSTESGELLQPCIEAALQLGCTPRRSSRSQRNESPGCYLKPNTSNPSPILPNNSSIRRNHPTNPPVFHYSQYLSNAIINSSQPGLKAENPNSWKRKCDSEELPITTKNFLPSNDNHVSMHGYASPTMWSVYPLHYDNDHQIQPDICTKKRSVFYSHDMANEKLGLPRNYTPDRQSSRLAFPSSDQHPGNQENEIECDLTLRLGSLVVRSAIVENSSLPAVENSNSGNFVKRRKLNS